jgi:uncharacterized protein DUF6328
MSLARKVKVALDETRMLVIGTQVLLGFQFNGAFQEGFSELPHGARRLHLIALVLLALTIGCLIVPTMQHRLVERGQASGRMQHLATRMAEYALLLFAVALGLDLFIVLQRPLGAAAAAGAGGTFALAALGTWFGLEFWWRRSIAMPKPAGEGQATPLDQKIEQMLTETRVMLPGVQALLGFDLLVTFNHAFESLSAGAKGVHIAGMGCAALAMILLMAPAAFHRITFGGEDTEAMHRIGSFLVTVAALPLGLSIGANAYVAAVRVTESAAAAATLGLGLSAVLLGLWYLKPFFDRRNAARAQRVSGARQR